MSALKKARSAGFSIRLIDDDKIGITPIEKLTDTQKQWLTEHRDDVLAELRAEASNESANVDIDLGSRWQLFVSLCIEHDVTCAEVEARFTPDDIADLVAEPDEKLPLHAQTIADDIKRTRTPQELIEHDIATSDVPELVRAIHAPTRTQTCRSCRHFRRHDWHGNLGKCAAGEPEAASGLWDNDPRNYCERWSS